MSLSIPLQASVHMKMVIRFKLPKHCQPSFDPPFWLFWFWQRTRNESAVNYPIIFRKGLGKIGKCSLDFVFWTQQRTLTADRKHVTTFRGAASNKGISVSHRRRQAYGQWWCHLHTSLRSAVPLALELLHKIVTAENFSQFLTKRGPILKYSKPWSLRKPTNGFSGPERNEL